MKRWGETTKTLGKAKSFAEVSDSVRRCTGDESAGAGLLNVAGIHMLVRSRERHNGWSPFERDCAYGLTCT